MWLLGCVGVFVNVVAGVCNVFGKIGRKFWVFAAVDVRLLCMIGVGCVLGVNRVSPFGGTCNAFVPWCKSEFVKVICFFLRRH